MWGILGCCAGRRDCWSCLVVEARGFAWCLGMHRTAPAKSCFVVLATQTGLHHTAQAGVELAILLYFFAKKCSVPSVIGRKLVKIMHDVRGTLEKMQVGLQEPTVAMACIFMQLSKPPSAHHVTIEVSPFSPQLSMFWWKPDFYLPDCSELVSRLFKR